MQKTNAIGIVAKAGRYEGTYAHKDIVFEIDLLVEHGEPLSNDTANKEDIGELSSRANHIRLAVSYSNIEIV